MVTYMLYEYTYCEAHRVADRLSHFACGFMAAAQRYRLAARLSLQKTQTPHEKSTRRPHQWGYRSQRFKRKNTNMQTNELKGK